MLAKFHIHIEIELHLFRPFMLQEGPRRSEENVTCAIQLIYHSLYKNHLKEMSLRCCINHNVFPHVPQSWLAFIIFCHF